MLEVLSLITDNNTKIKAPSHMITISSSFTCDIPTRRRQ